MHERSHTTRPRTGVTVMPWLYLVLVADSRRGRCETPTKGPKRCQCWSPPVAAGGRDSSASDVIASVPRAASSSTSVASSPERA